MWYNGKVMKTSVCFVVLSMWLTAPCLMAQDPLKAAPKNYRVLLENDRVRVLEYRAKPGEKTAMHTHPASVIYPLTAAKARYIYANGKIAEVEAKAGAVDWVGAVTHSVENIGTSEIRALLIELKEPRKKSK